MQHKPRFSGIIIAAVLMVAALVMISSYSSLFASSKSTMMLSEAMGYFESNQVTYFNLDLNEKPCTVTKAAAALKFS